MDEPTSKSLPVPPTLCSPPEERLAQLWGQGQQPNVQQFLAEVPDLSPAHVAAVLGVDQWERWQRGERIAAETYLERYPILQGDVEGAVELVYGEFLLREQLGEAPALDEFVHRFPQYAARLQQQLELHRALGTGSLGDSETAAATGVASVSRSKRSQVWPTLAGYEILGVLGRGGMGVVYKARQLSLNRLVALKMILAGAHAGPHELARFHTEAEAAARLQHPNIVQVYEIGTQDGRPFLALEFVDGSLAKSLAGTPLPPRQAAQWAETLARAVHYAHQHGVVHRDLKPGNVLLSRDGQLKIADFGMAKIMAGRVGGHTQSGALVGTPSYMAPEQAEGRIRQLGPATDVYGLGAILYELLTGRPPFRAASMQETLDQVRHEQPTPPSHLQPKLPRDLETICLTCLQKEPTRRYSSAAALAEDLHAFLAGEPIRSRPPGPWDRLLHWARRRPAEAVLVASGSVAFIGLGVGIFWSHALLVGAVAGLSLLVGSWWYSARLQRALREVTRQQVLAERSVERLQLLLEMTRRLVRTTQLEELLRLLAESAARLTNAEFSTIYLLDRERGELWSMVTMDEEVGEIRLPLGVGIAGSVALTGEPVNIPDAYADPRFDPTVDRRTGHRTRNLLTVPMTDQDGTMLGVFQVINKQEGAFGVEDIEILSSLAASAAIGIEGKDDLGARRDGDQPG
jgi:serine/threonine-protein kinase